MKSLQTCPICGDAVSAYARFPRYLCQDCMAKAADQSGRVLRFRNTALGGGYAAEYADTAEPYPSHDCWVEGRQCVAEEAYFGGIVIQAIAD